MPGATLDLIASCAFGVESVLKREIASLGLEPRATGPGRVEFEGGPADVVRANLWLRSASRVGLKAAAARIADFDGLYELIRGIDWREILPPDASPVVNIRASRSAINSPRSAQGVVKRAIVDTMVGRGSTLPETGPRLGVEVAIIKDDAVVVLDTSGAALHRRGYRVRSQPGQLKETLAAAIVQVTGWRGDRPLIDPFCGRGTIVIEAAMIAAGLAPSRHRTFAGEHLAWIDADRWSSARAEALAVDAPRGLPQMLGRDADSSAVRDARRSAEAAGVTGLVGFRTQDYADLPKPADRGWVITNPPYGLRVLDSDRAREIHESLPSVLASLPGWSHAILTGYEGFETLIKQDASKRRKLFNGRVRADLYIFKPRVGSDAEPAKAAFGDTSDRDQIASTFESTLRKWVRHTRRWPGRGIESFRLYDGQTPGAPIYIDRYADHLMISDVRRRNDRAVGDERAWLDRLIGIACHATDVPRERVHVKERRRQRGADQYGAFGEMPKVVTVAERGLRFEVELATRLDAGLFLDHRPARELVQKWSDERRVLNLFAYTGAFTVAAAAGGASATTSVDLSPVYADWTDRNLAANGLQAGPHEIIVGDAVDWLREASRGRRYELIVLDPPSFSNSKRTPTVLDVQRDHVELIELCLAMLEPGGRLLFSTNKRGFTLDSSLDGRPMTHRTVPEDFPHSRPHQSWVFDVPKS
ncbi:MAG: bifunctional 23S rRNA (guanine(2069)-N(7))-methyltransferase RlmK/23S rRNA (guanine(2445)-N(2))-methyltransferase RlmL [Planctomycetota bacterium]